tara:strand:+ start:1075 stop:1422 length:348 start_codon:yes stop_codon:yes gene_type:complete
MGYTHYWWRAKNFPQKAWDPFIKEVKPMLERADCLTDLKFCHDQILFNGVAEKSQVFVFPKTYESWFPEQEPDENGRWFDFCKTSRLPYDKYVAKTLASANEWFGDLIVIKSDPL